MIVLVPLSRFRITYEIAAGRPFSQLERMILRAIKDGASELAELRDTFQVHPRLLIEGLVTLTHAGWLSIGGPGHEGFVLTSGGNEAATSDRPPSTTEVSSRQASVVMERLTGALISNSDVRFTSRNELDHVWDHVVKLAAEVTDNRLDEGQVQHLLPRQQGEWVRWIGPIDMLTKDANWLPVNVEIQPENVVGLPDPWVPRLQKTIMAKAHRAVEAESLDQKGRSLSWPLGGQKLSRAGSDEDGPETLRVPPLSWSSTVSKDDFCFTANDHEKLAVAAFGEAQTSILVASAFANTEKLELLRECIDATLERGVNIDLLWGYTAEGGQNRRALIEWLSKVAYRAKRDGWGLLRFNKEPSDSHGKLLLWDGPTGFNACIGSYNWLSTLVSQDEASLPRNVTVQISEPAIVAALARCAAGFWSAVETDVLLSTADRWRRVAADLDMVAAHEDTPIANAKVRLILDREHDALLHDWMSKAQSRFLVASHKLGAASETHLVNADVERPSSFDFNVLYGQTDEDETGLAIVDKLVRRTGGVLRHVPHFHATALISDTSACVTSYNFLSADPFGTSKKTREIGLVIEGQQSADWLWRQLNTA